MKSEEYLNEIRRSAGLRRAILKKITVEGQRATFRLVTDLNYSQEDISYAWEVSQRYVPDGMTAQAEIIKSVPSAEGVGTEIARFLRSRFPAAAAFISPGDIEVVTDGTGGRFFLSVGEAERAQFSHGDVLDALSAELMRNFPGSWFGAYRKIEREQGEIEHEELAPPERVLAPRVFEICNYVPIDGASPKTALYIADLAGEQTNVTVCGQVTYIEERLTKNEKPYFSITVSDGSGQLRASYFSKKATLEKVRSVKQGDSVCLTGANELFGGGFRFTVKQLDFGSPPENFVPEAPPSRPVPAKYAAVFPEAVTDLVQADVFGIAALPQDFCGGKFVVFDLETTGLIHSPAQGPMDRIIEVGAVRIENGSICEKFSSFVSCPVKLSEEIVKLTGIDDSMLVGAPAIGDVIADFYKFCDGAVLVGHNVQFDLGFVRYYGEKEGFRFSHRQCDTVSLSQEMLRLSNYKLNTVADHFKFTFNHHRAFDDAFVTAKIFIELVRLKGKLPKF